MQLNLSLSFFSEEEVLEMAAGEKNLYYAIGHQSDLSDFIVHTKYENLDLVPSSTLMSSVEYELFTKWQREFILRKCLQKVKDSGVYDYILIDCTAYSWRLGDEYFMCIRLCSCSGRGKSVGYVWSCKYV